MLDESNNITIKQHFVPRFYMEHFSEVKGSGKKKKVLIGFYQFNDKEERECVPIKSICYEKSFYGEDGKVEKQLAAKEKVWASVIKKAIEMNSYDLSYEEELVIKEFAIYQDRRTLGIFKDLKKTNKEVVKELGNIKDQERFMKEIESKKVNELNFCEEYVKCIGDLNISVISFTTKTKLIISDIPVIKLNPLFTGGVGFVRAGFIMLFPISPEKCILIYDKKIYKECASYMVIDTEEDVIKLNKYQVLNSDERILSKKVSELKVLYNDNDLLNLREKYRNKSGVSSFGSVNNKLIKSELKSLNYEYELSFLKIPRYIRKIPIVCRNDMAFDRKYSEESREMLRIKAYLDNYGLSCNKKDRKKLKSGYINMLRFIEDYWEIENERRKITPQFMKKVDQLNKVLKLHKG